MGFKMMPGSRDHGLKTGKGLVQRGLISGGPKMHGKDGMPHGKKAEKKDKMSS
tara:strand:+ start:560 stop:718 length:159 start_codon:yes stop_codon:yes gene_type:complete